MDYKARFYSPMLGRFLQPDSLIPDPANPQAWNRYSYVANNPVNLNDPSGHCYTSSGIWLSGGGDGDCPGASGGGGGGGGSGNNDDGDGGGGDFCDPVLGCENPDTGVFCDQNRCWKDGATDVGGTWQDPAVYISGVAACLMTGCVANIIAAFSAGRATVITWLALWSTENPDGLTVSIGRFSEYLDKARTYGYTVFNMGKSYNFFNSIGLAEPANDEFMATQMNQLKNFVGSGALDPGTSYSREVEMLSSNLQYIQTGPASWESLMNLYSNLSNWWME